MQEPLATDQNPQPQAATATSRLAPFAPNMKPLLREPLIHFLVIGALLFAAYGFMQRGRHNAQSPKEIQLTVDDLGQIVLLFRSQWARDPSPTELRNLVEQKVKEEILYREAVAMGLEKGDTIVKRRMAQKMQFLAEDVAAAREPTPDQLKEWFATNTNKFAMPGRYSLRHVYFSPDKRGANARDDAANALTRLAGQPVDSNLAASLGDQFMFQDYYGDRTPESLAKEFGPQFAVAVERLKPGSWQGPIESGLGWHLVFVDSVIPGREPAFEEVEGDVKIAWLAQQKTEAWEKAYKEIRAKYTVLIPSPPTNETASAPPTPDKKAL